MSVEKKIKKTLTTAIKWKERRVISDMLEDPKDLARAMFWENDRKQGGGRRVRSRDCTEGCVEEWLSGYRYNSLTTREELQ